MMFPHFPSSHIREDVQSGDAAPWLLDALLLGGVLALAWRACHARHRHRRRGSSARAPEAVHRWEGEGGRPLPAEHAASGVAARPS